MIDKIIPLLLKDRFHQATWLLISFLILGSWLLSESNVLIQAISQILTPILVKITLSLLLLCIGLIASLITLYFKLQVKPNLTEYNYIENPGYYVHKKTKYKYCGNCIDKHNKLHRLSFDPKRGLICRPCGNSYVSPQDYQSAWKQATQNDKNS
jgi:hypothetical protein